MASNLLIGYPSIIQSAASVAVYGGFGSNDSNYPLTNAGCGPRSNFVRNGTPGQYFGIRWDLGASLTMSAEFLFVAGATLTSRLGGDTLKLISYDGITQTDFLGTNSNLGTKTFTGPESEDIIIASGFNNDFAIGIPSANFRYWQLLLGKSSATSQSWAFRKAFFGLFFDFGRDPVRLVPQERKVDNPNQRRAPYVFGATWEGINDTTRQTFIDNILARSDFMGIVLYDSGNLFLNGFRTLHCRITKCKITPVVKNSAKIELQFTELV